tara:strand:+ start:321 stop:722 length:402 start_codon:yes stop_codon:yes gene_type:complete
LYVKKLTEERKIPLGSPVIIDTINSKYNLQNELNRDIALMPEGIVTAYSKEHSGHFLIIKLRSNIEIKITENELSECTKSYYYSDKSYFSNLYERIKDFLEMEYVLNGNKKIKYILNPFTFLQWIKYAIKDVF